MAVVNANSIAINVIELGVEDATPPVVMLHGIVIDNLSSFYYTLANHAASAHHVVLYDQRGHGRSDRPSSGYSVDDNVEDLSELLKALYIDEPVVLVGNSFGGTIAIGFALKYPERVAGLALIEAHFAVEGWGDEMASTLRRTADLAREGLAMEKVLRETGSLPKEGLPALQKVGLSPEEVQFVIQWIEDNSRRKATRMGKTAKALLDGTTLIDDLQSEKPLSEEQLKSIKCPTLVIYGEQSDIIDRAHDLARCLPQAELNVIEGQNHSVLMAASDKVRDILLPWLAERSAIAAIGGSVKNDISNDGIPADTALLCDRS